MAKTQQKNEFEPVIEGFVKGVPYPKSKSTGNRKNLERGWQEEVKKQTAEYKGKVKGPCHLDVVFYLTEDKYHPVNANYGPDLDNLAKLFLDGLKETVFNSVGCDGDACVVSLLLRKVKVTSKEEAGALFKISLFQIHKIIKVEEVTGVDLGIPKWKDPMQKITTATGVYLDNMPGVSHNKKFPPGYNWESEEGKEVFDAEVCESNDYLWLKKEAK